MGRLDGKVAIITGAAKGIGEGCARVLASEGARVVVADVDETAGRDTASKIKQNGRQAVFVRCDVTKIADMQGVADATVKRFGRIDTIVNNAGTHDSKGIEAVDEKSWDFLFSLNLRSQFLLVKAALPELKKTKGSIINISSMVGVGGQKDAAAYVPTKSGSIGFTKALALDLGAYGIRVNCVCPAACDTPLLRKWLDAQPNRDEISKWLNEKHPLKRMGQPEDIGKAVAFLASDDASFITGVVLPVDGGFTLGY
jgi:NAD(P)-dependent dehydrogenase (short-subunit alcohol dehydrogenase family)